MGWQCSVALATHSNASVAPKVVPKTVAKFGAKVAAMHAQRTHGIDQVFLLYVIVLLLGTRCVMYFCILVLCIILAFYKIFYCFIMISNIFLCFCIVVMIVVLYQNDLNYVLTMF